MLLKLPEFKFFVIHLNRKCWKKLRNIWSRQFKITRELIYLYCRSNFIRWIAMNMKTKYMGNMSMVCLKNG